MVCSKRTIINVHELKSKWSNNYRKLYSIIIIYRFHMALGRHGARFGVIPIATVVRVRRLGFSTDHTKTGKSSD